MKLGTGKRAAEILGVTQARFYELVRTQILPPGVIIRLGRQIRVDEDALEAWIRSGGQTLAGGWRRAAD
jgi:excisionase family DNA binding protein